MQFSDESPLLAYFSPVLPAHLFQRTHRCYIVAIHKITAFTAHDIEIGGIEIPISRLYAQQSEQAHKMKTAQ